MIKIILKASKHILNQLKKSKEIPDSEVFDEEAVYLSDIKYGKSYYSGIIFVPSIENNFHYLGEIHAVLTLHTVKVL